MHGGVKFYRGSAGAARSYVEADRSRVDDYYLAEGTGLAERYVATPTSEGVRPGGTCQDGVVRAAGTLDGPAYERWVAGYDVETGQPKGRLRTRRAGPAVRRGRGQRSEDLVAGRRAAPGDRRRLRRRPGQGRGRDHRLARRARHHPGRAARPAGAGAGRAARGCRGAALHLPGRRPAPPPPPADQRPRLRRRRVARAALGRRGGQHRGDQRDRARRSHVRPRVPRGCSPRTGTPSTPRPARSPSSRRTPGRSAPAPRRSPATSTATRPSGAASIPDEEPGPTLRRAWDRRAWAQARPDKVVPESGAELRQRWVEELHQLGFTPPTVGVEHRAVAIGRVNRDAVVDLVLSRLGARRSSWNAADIRGEVERIIAAVDIVAHGAGTPRAGRGPDRPHRRPLRAAPRPRRRTRTRPLPYLPPGARRRGRPGRPTHVTRRAALDAPIRSAPWSRGVASTTPNARSSPHSAAPHSSWSSKELPGPARPPPWPPPASCSRCRTSGWWW